MIKFTTIQEIRRELNRFSEKLTAVEKAVKEIPDIKKRKYIEGGAVIAALKRSSLDLSKAMVKIRKSGYDT